MPAELLSSSAIPIPPAGMTMQSDVAAYILDLFDADRECKRKLDAVRSLLAPD